MGTYIKWIIFFTGSAICFASFFAAFFFRCVLFIMFPLFNERRLWNKCTFFRGCRHAQTTWFVLHIKKNVVSKLIVSLPLCVMPLLPIFATLCYCCCRCSCDANSLSTATNQNINNLQQHLSIWKPWICCTRVRLLIIECNNSRIIYLIFAL